MSQTLRDIIPIIKIIKEIKSNRFSILYNKLQVIYKIFDDNERDLELYRFI